MTYVDTGICLLKLSVFLRLLLSAVIIISALYFEHDADAFKPPNYSKLGETIGLELLLTGFNRWDSVYFNFIAEFGYIYDNCSAFFPLLPFLIHVIASIIKTFLLYSANLSVIIRCVGPVLNFFFSVCGTIQLYRLSLLVFNCERLSFLAALLFCINPASVFFAVTYSESLFFCLILTGLFYYECGSLLTASVFFGLASLTRSNGILYIGFLIYPFFLDIGSQTLAKFSASYAHLFRHCISVTLQWLFMVVTKLFLPIILSLVTLGPFLSYQLYIYKLFCDPAQLIDGFQWSLPQSMGDEFHHFAQTSELSVPLHLRVNGSEKTAWCDFNVGLPYGHIQKLYWNVGPFNYFTIKQLPNFVLATPVLCLCLCVACTFYQRAPKAYATFGIHSESPIERKLVPYLFHMIFLSVFGLTHIHVQVLTRMLFSSCPILYWFCAHALYRKTDVLAILTQQTAAGQEKRRKRDVVRLKNLPWSLLHAINPASYNLTKDRILLYFFWGYCLIGCILHPMFLPWT